MSKEMNIKCFQTKSSTVIQFLLVKKFHFLLLKVITEEDYKKWLFMRQEAKSAIEKKEDLLMDTAAYMENKLTLLGKLKNKK